MFARILRRSPGRLQSSLAIALVASISAAAVSAQTPPALTQKPYAKLTNTSRSVTNFNVEVVRGFVVRPDLSELFAINAYESSIVHHVFPVTLPVSQPADHWRTITNPVSIAFVGLDGLLVVGQGTHGIARHDTTTGQIVDYLQLRSEPADLVVDEDNDECWVSCMGDDSVCQIGLSPSLHLIKVWGKSDRLIVKRPRFLYLERNTNHPRENRVYVAPLISGTNSLVPDFLPAPIDPEGTSWSSWFPFNPTIGGRGLPDYDLYRIAPLTGTVEPVVRGAGSILLAHGLNPATNKYWMLNVDEDNANPMLDTETALRGVFASNRLSITKLAATPPTLAQAGTSIDLDNTTPGSTTPTYVPSRSVSFPYALEIDPMTGWAFIASSTTPNIVLVDPNGARFPIDFSLSNPTLNIGGSVVRTMTFASPFLFAYCQETSNVLIWLLAPFNPAPFASLSLGNDPTPASVKLGRRIWYDATPSLDGRTTCNTCHPQGGADGLAWRIAGPPVDHKPTMVTQTLMGIEDSFPYHWRGERDLQAFNAAFPGLLGHSRQLTAAELTHFVEFCFSLTPPANPAQDRSRRLKDSLQSTAQENGVVGDVTDGDFWYHNALSTDILGLRTCVSCHGDPTGSDGDVMPDNPSRVTSETQLEAVQLDSQLPLKDQELIDVPWSNGVFGGVLKLPWLGAGLAHDGTAHSLFDFLTRFPLLTGQQQADVTAFVKLFDHGIAPSVHFGARLFSGSASGTGTQIKTDLLAQATNGWVGCIVIGTFPIGGSPRPMTWYFDAGSQLFIPADSTLIGPQPMSAFDGAAASGLGDNLFLGVPPGNERRLGVDFDNDGLALDGELAAGTDPWEPDSDFDKWPDGYEVAQLSSPLIQNQPSDTAGPTIVGGPSGIVLDFANATMAKFHFKTNEPARWSISCSTAGGATITDQRQTYDTIHTAIVQRLEPSTSGIKTNNFTGSLVLTDLQGNTSSVSLPAFDSGSMAHDGTLHEVVIGDMTISNQGRGPTWFKATVDLRVDFKEQGPPAITSPDQIVVGQLLKAKPNPVAPNDPDWDIVPFNDIVTMNATLTQSLQLDGTPFDLSGPFLVLPATPPGTTSTGLTGLDFTVNNLTANQKVMFNVLMIERGSTYMVGPGGPEFRVQPTTSPTDDSPNQYAMPSTPPERRRIVSTL